MDIINEARNQLAAISTQREITQDLFKSFIDFLDTSDKTAVIYTRVLRQFFIYLQDNNIMNPKRSDILEYKRQLSTTKAASTVQLYMTVARQFFKWADTQGIYKDITKNIKGVKVSKEHKKDYLTVEQIKDILANIDISTDKGLRDYTIITLMTTTALRTIEVSRANVEDLRVSGENTVLYIQGKGKTEKNDYVIIPSDLLKLLYNYINKMGLKPGEPIFTSLSNNNNKERLTTRSISRLVKDRFISAGYNSDRLTAHSLRHTAITLALLQNMDIVEVKEFARHSNINTTMIYNHSIEKSKNKCSAAITNIIL